jgi:hypothetical protein
VLIAAALLSTMGDTALGPMMTVRVEVRREETKGGRERIGLSTL